MARHRLLLAALFVALGIGACGDHPACELLNDCEVVDDSPVSETLIHTDAADAIFFEATLTDGQTLIVAGPKAADGTPLAVAEMTLTDGNETTQFLFDEDERLSTILRDDTMIDVAYLDETHVVMTAVDLATGDEERVNFTLAQSQASVVDGAPSGSTAATPEGVELYGTVSETIVNLTRCGGESLNDGCPVTLSGTIDGKLFKAVPRCGGLGTGTYPFPMPGAPSSVNQSTICNIAGFLARKAVLAVTLFKPGCLLFIETGIGTVICVAALNGVESLADFLGINPAGNATRWLCGKAAGTVEFGGDFVPNQTTYSLTTTAKYNKDLKTKTVSGTLDVDGRWPDIDLDFPDGSNRIAVEPDDPIPGQSYVAYGHVECVPPSGTVDLSVSGSDGYEGAASDMLSGAGTVTLSVPGGGASVIDTLSLTINGAEVKNTKVVF